MVEDALPKSSKCIARNFAFASLLISLQNMTLLILSSVTLIMVSNSQKKKATQRKNRAYKYKYKERIEQSLQYTKEKFDLIVRIHNVLYFRLYIAQISMSIAYISPITYLYYDLENCFVSSCFSSFFLLF